MEKTTNDITKALGETGADIQSEEEINMSQSNQFTNLWSKRSLIQLSKSSISNILSQSNPVSTSLLSIDLTSKLVLESEPVENPEVTSERVLDMEVDSESSGSESSCKESTNVKE